MRYNINKTVSATDALEYYIENLRGGFGDGRDNVGNSYDYLYRDLKKEFSNIRLLVNNANSVVSSLDVPDIDNICYKANDMIRKAQSFVI